MSLARAALNDPRAANPLLSAEGAADELRRSGVPLDRVVPTYVRAKPGAGMLVGYRLHGHAPDGERIERDAYVRTLPPARAASTVAKWATMRPAPTPFGPGFRPLADGRSVLFVFPTDARLRDLRVVAEPKKLKRVLTELPELAGRGVRVSGKRSAFRPVRYKPERRFIVDADLALTDGERTARLPAFLRLFPDGRGAGIAATAEWLRTASGGGLVPRPVGALLGGRLFIEERVDGVELVERVLDGTADADALADALERLHAAPPPPGLSRRAPAGVAAGVAEGLSTMAALAPGLRASVTTVVRRLDAVRPPEARSAPIHGDLHLHQVVVGSDGPVFVDLERAAIGDPLQDLAELAAHLDDLAPSRPASAERLRRFRDAVVERSLRSMHRGAERDLRFYVGVALANRALLPFRRLERRWPERSEALLNLAAEALEAR